MPDCEPLVGKAAPYLACHASLSTSCLVTLYLGPMTPTPTAAPYFGLFGGNPDPLLELLLSLMRALVILVVALVLANFVKRWLVRLLSRSRLSLNIAVLLGNVLQVMVIVLGVLPVLRAFGIDWPALLTVLGAAGLALSLSMQDILKNVIAGIYILLEQPFKIGDRISVKEATGVVRGIELRTTIVSTDDGLQMVVPNSTVLNEIVTNRSASDLQRQVIVLRMPKGSLTEISNQISATLKTFPAIAPSPAPVVALEGVHRGVAKIRVEYWVPDGTNIATVPQVVEALQSSFPDANVTVV